MWQFIKKRLLMIVVLIGVIRGIILAPYIWDEKPAIKLLVFGVGLLNITLFLLYNRYNKNSNKLQAGLCDTCGLFVPLDIENSNHLKPHCCYMKPTNR